MHKTTILNNGLSLLTQSMPHTKSVSIAFFIGAGSRYESNDIAGASHFLEHLLFKGTKRWPTARELSEAIEGVGGVMNASTDREMTTYWCKVPKAHFRISLDLLIDMIRNPLLDPVEIEKEREVVIEELRMTNDYPANRVDLLIDDTIWPDQAMGRDVGGSIQSVKDISHNNIYDYLSKQYTPTNTVLSIAGDVEHEEIVEAISDQLDGWESTNPMDWYPVEGHQSASRTRLEHRASDQAHICIGLPGLSLSDPDRYALSLMNVILGGGMSSRLFLEVRERQSLAYDVHSSISMFRDCGSMVVYCGVEPKKSERAINAILGQLADLEHNISDGEVSKAKEVAKGHMILRMEDSRNVAMWMGAQKLLLGNVFTQDEIYERIDRVTSEDIMRVAKGLIHSDKLNLAVVGPYKSDKKFTQLLTLPSH